MNKPRVMVAMSGGVDSSVAAYLLLQAGYEVVGATLQIWPAGREESGGCCGWQAVADAREVAYKLEIPHYVLNYQQAFETRVIDPFCQEYLRGRTPNPCITCNRYIKFGGMLEQALAMGFDYLATGHYARRERNEESGRFLLRRGLDPKKDQSYVLYNLEQQQLSHLLFPLGEYSKTEIRQIARELDLIVAEKPESQEICFVPDNDYGAFVAGRTPEGMVPGLIEDTRGNVLGKHQGIAHFTIGQRRGLGIAAGTPLYVVALDSERNVVVVGSNDEVLSERCLASDVNWIAIEDLKEAMEVQAQIRYTARPAPAVISPRPDGRVAVEFRQPVRALTPGQAVVFYHGDLVIGGGTIELPDIEARHSGGLSLD